MGGSAPPKVAIDEFVQITIENGLDVPGLDVRTEILHHLIGLEHIAPNLATPGGLALLPTDFVDLSNPLLASPLMEPRLED
jgi:hypothetical protein